MTLTKDYLEYLGITEITEDGTIFTKNGPLKPQKVNDECKYLKIQLCEPGGKGKVQNLHIHRLVWTWFNRVLPDGMEIHHIDFDPANNTLSNLECLTHEEHLEKHASDKEIKCRLDIPREWYIKKIETSKNQAKYTYKCKLRYFDNHIEEHEKLMQLKKEIELIKYLKKEFKAKGDTYMWHQFRQLEVQWASIEAKLRSQILDSAMKYCI